MAKILRLIKAELYKLFKNKTLKVLCVVSIVLSILMAVLASPMMGKIMMDSLGDLPPEQKEEVLQQMTIGSEAEVVVPGQLGFNLTAKDPMNPTALEVYHASFGAGAVEILIGILVAAFLAKEYTDGTIKNTLAYGKKRWEFYIAKFIALVIGMSVLTIALTSVSTIAATIMNGWGQEFEMAQLLGMGGTFLTSILANAAVASIIMIFAILIRSNGGTIGITVAIFILIPSVLSFLYGIYPWFDNIYELTPFYNSALATSVYSSGNDLIKSSIISIGTTIISLLIGVQIFKSQDIK